MLLPCREGEGKVLPGGGGQEPPPNIILFLLLIGRGGERSEGVT